MSTGVHTKDPDAVLDYTLDLSAWLPEGDSVQTASATVTQGDVVVDSCTATPPDKVVLWLSAGTTGTRAQVTVHWTTTAGREDDRTLQLRISER